ncbi:DUF2190 family protein [Pinibacter soli]|uniref:DUF2190 family protein n=1 Tax=Pinibacter soli TaxID=3044211 RepID=A0ABT6RBP0_9BACT|nr:DUF2190 family protein [Pinibacter soli]MDI3319985.1 DUF2190 family protein [Pinibacter soli]
MNTLVSSGKTVEVVTPSGGYGSGQPVLLGSIVGISANKYAQNDTAVIYLVGAHKVAKASGAAWAVGDKIYWDDTAKVFTKTATSNTLAGYAWAAALSADATGVIFLRQ